MSAQLAAAAWNMWGRTRSDLRAELERTRFASRARARNRLMVLELVAKGLVLDERPHSTLPAELLEEWATERWGEDAPGRDASTFLRAIRDLERTGWLDVERRGPRLTWQGIRRPALVLRAGKRLLALLGIVRRVVAGLSRRVIDSVQDRLDMARRLFTRQPRSTPFSPQRVLNPKEETIAASAERLRALIAARASPPG